MKIYDPSAFDRLPDVIWFDMDNTFYHYDPPHKAAQLMVQKKAMSTFAISKKDFISAYEQARQKIKSQLDKTASSHSRLLYFQRTFEILGLGSQPLMALDFEQTYWRTFLSHVKLFDGLIPLLDEIRIMGIPMGIITDLTAQVQFRKIIYFKLDQYFDHIVTSEESGFDKPHPASFKLIFEKMQCKKSDRVWMIGDHPAGDILGAKNSMGAVGIQKIHNGVEEGVEAKRPDAALKNFLDLKKILNKLRVQNNKK